MRGRTRYLYRVNVTLPEGAEGNWHWKPPADIWGDDADAQHPQRRRWNHEGNGYSEPHDTWADQDDDGRFMFRWPVRRCFLSKSSADQCADTFREFGAVASVERSCPVAWPSAGVAQQ